jgi:hypothetical protein
MTDSVENVIRLTAEMIEKIGPRPAGSRASRECADALKAEAEGFADHSHTEDFTVHPAAFLGWIRILVVLYAAAALGLWLNFYAVSVLLIVLAITILILQFFFYRELLDPFFLRLTGRNVLASINPRGEVLGELIISGHHDSARIFNFLVHQPGLYALRINGGIGSLVLLGLVSAVLWILKITSGQEVSWFRIPALAFTVLFLLVIQLWWFASDRHTSGAGDNLASSAAAWEVLRVCSLAKKEGHGFNHLKVTAASWDAEEAGLRGARAWRKNRFNDPLPHPAWNLNLECLYDEKDFFLLTSDINGSVKLSTDLAGRCAGLMKTGSDLTVPALPIAFLTGGTDAGETARAGVESTTLMGMPWGNSKRAAVYHTTEDVIDAVSRKAVSAAMRLALDLAEELDGKLTSASD